MTIDIQEELALAAVQEAADRLIECESESDDDIFELLDGFYELVDDYSDEYLL